MLVCHKLCHEIARAEAFDLKHNLLKYNCDFIASSHSHLPRCGDVQDICNFVQAEWLGMY